VDPTIPLARGTSFGDLAHDPALTIACVLLVVVSIGWIVMSRLITRELRRAAARAARRREAPRPPKDIWRLPPN
jgi:hypothetical protein